MKYTLCSLALLTGSFALMPHAALAADGSIYMDDIQQFRYVDVDKAVRAALTAGKPKSPIILAVNVTAVPLP
ncbi:hypothetical protein GE278_12175 [Enterobacteriaceae bacterium Kacie_13]|nr:hypothetical protein GE278_12175 [Enterobacteriaceae bacterium Kacie_13]